MVCHYGPRRIRLRCGCDGDDKTSAFRHHGGSPTGRQQVADALGISRSGVVEIELGNRAISGLELERIAQTVGRDMRDFLASEFRAEDILSALFRTSAADVAERADISMQLSKCFSVAREFQQLESLLEISHQSKLNTSYVFEPPRSRWDAIQQGEHAANSERRRLDLGASPVRDLMSLLDDEGVNVTAVALPDDVSGLAITKGTVAPFIAVNKSHPSVRLRFSLAHEFCHVLVDRAQTGRISRASERDDLIEVRSNSFAAAFLMPEDGVRSATEALGKGLPSRMASEVFDEDVSLRAERRTEAFSQDIQYYDVLRLAGEFGVSASAMMYRLKNLRLITDNELKALREQDAAPRSERLRQIIGDTLAKFSNEDAAGRNQRLVVLALEAFRRMKITESKLVELFGMVEGRQIDVHELLASAGLLDDDGNA